MDRSKATLQPPWWAGFRCGRVSNILSSEHHQLRRQHEWRPHDANATEKPVSGVEPQSSVCDVAQHLTDGLGCPRSDSSRQPHTHGARENKPTIAVSVTKSSDRWRANPQITPAYNQMVLKLISAWASLALEDRTRLMPAVTTVQRPVMLLWLWAYRYLDEVGLLRPLVRRSIRSLLAITSIQCGLYLLVQHRDADGGGRALDHLRGWSGGYYHVVGSRTPVVFAV